MSESEISKAEIKGRIRFLEKTKRPDQRIGNTLNTVNFSRRRLLLSKFNTKYGKPQQLLGGRGLFGLGQSNPSITVPKGSDSNQPTEDCNETLENLKAREEILKERMFQMNIYFSELSDKKLTKLYETINEITHIEKLVENVEYCTISQSNEYKTKPKQVTLSSNFLIIASGKSSYKEIYYLNNPVVQKEENTDLVINSTHFIRFKEVEKRDLWYQTLKSLSIWVEHIPRSLMKESDSNGYLVMDNTSNSSPRSRTPNTPSQSPQQSPIPTPRKSEKRAENKHQKSRSVSSKKEKKVKLFGVSLMEYSKEYNSDTLPPQIKELIQYLKVNGSNTEGLFRICGNEDTIQIIKVNLESNDTSIFPSVNIHDLSSCLKKYIREMPFPIIPPEFDSQFKQLLSSLFFDYLR